MQKVGKARRGVLMTATSRRNWREEASSAARDEDMRKASQKEWSEMMQEVEESRNSCVSTILTDPPNLRDVAAYDDVVVEKDSNASDSEAERDEKEKEETNIAVEKDPYEDDGAVQDKDSQSTPQTAADLRRRMQSSLCEEVEAPKDPEEQKRLEDLDEQKRLRLFNLKAIREEQEKDEKEKDKKRGGKKESGAKRKRKRADGTEEGGGPPLKKKKKTDEDPNRWIEARLEGEDKPKKLDTTRLVTYRDFDSNPERKYKDFDYVPETRVSGKAAINSSEPSAGSKGEKKEKKTLTAKRDFRRQSLYEDLFD